MTIKLKSSTFKFSAFSNKQLKVLTWWQHSIHKEKEAIICDGSVRAGKTLIMSLSYVLWSMTEFNQEQFGMAGKTIGSLRRNVIRPLKNMLSARGFYVKDHRSDNMLEVIKKGKVNYYFLFGGKDEASQDLVQGLTAAGFFFDEVALMPQSFVNQATARCSVDGSKLWFNMNPEGPFHWFKKDWIDNAATKHALHIHFTMDDNPSLTDKVKARYQRMYSGVFYQRYILGLWVVSEGIIYDNFNREKMVVNIPDTIIFEKYYVAIDYGTQNPTVFKLWALSKGTWYCIDEYYHSGRESKKQKTDKEYSNDLKSFVGSRKVTVIVDPSAASFIAQLRQDGFTVEKAKNDVLDGIRSVQVAMNEGSIKWTDKCEHTIQEFNAYSWDSKAAERGEDKPIKEHDHCMDADRYFVYKVLFKSPVVSVTKKIKGIR